MNAGRVTMSERKLPKEYTLNLPKGWEWKKLGELCEKTSNINWGINNNTVYKYIDLSAVSRETLSITGYQNISSANAPSRAKKIVLNNDVIFATTRPTLKRATIIDDEFNGQICSTGFSVLRPQKDKILSKYIFYHLLTEAFMSYVEILQKGASYPAITDTEVKDYRIPIPPIPEQKRIVAILDKAFAAIDQAKANAEKNLQNSRELFESYLNKIFANPGEDWVMKQLADICLKTENIRWQENQTTNFLYIDLSSVSRESLSIENSQNINAENAPSRAKKIVKTNDIIFGTTRPTLKRVAKIDAEYNEQICSTGFVILRANSLEIYPEWIFYFLQTSSFIEKMRKIQKGASYPAVTEREVKNELIPIPPLFIQKDEIKRLTSLKKQTKKLETIYKQKLADLEELKKSILQKAFNGEL